MKVTWLGDPEDESQKQTELYGLTFVKGTPTDVPKGYRYSFFAGDPVAKLKGNRFFKVED